MLKNSWPRLLVVSSVLLVAGGFRVARAADYSGVRLWDTGPFTVWVGTNHDDPTQNIMGIKGAKKSIFITYAPGAAPAIQYYSSHAELTLPAGKKLQPVGPHQGFILYCTNNGPDIICYCTVSDPDNVCDQGGIVSGTPDSTWYDL